MARTLGVREGNAELHGPDPHPGWNRRDFLRAGLVGGTTLAIGGLAGFTIGRATAPVAPAIPTVGQMPQSGAEPATFPVTIAADGRSFVDEAGMPFYYLADTAWNAISRMTIESFEVLAAGRAERGFSALQLSILDFNPSARNAYGRAPFDTVGALDKPAVDGSDNYWSLVDRCLDTCQAFGLLACLVPAWYGGWGDAWRGHLTEANATAYGAFLAERYGDRSNVWWLLGGDNSPSDDGNNVQGVPAGLDRGPRTAHTIAMGRALYEGSAVKPLMSYHTARTNDVEADFGAEPWYRISAAYSGEDPVPYVSAEYQRETVRPVVLWEAYYDGRTRDPVLGQIALRAQAYHALLSGAAGFSYGHELVWPVLDGWSKALDAPSARDMDVFAGIVSTFVGGYVAPLTTGGDNAARLFPDGYGTPGTPSRITAGLLPNRSGAIAYFQTPHPDVVVDTTAIDPDESFQIRWINPATGEEFFFGEGRHGTDIAVNWPSSWVDAVLVLNR